METTQSILNFVKKEVGIEPDYNHFDLDVIACINSAFYTLYTLGVGPWDAPFSIENENNTWSEFKGPGVSELVKKYLALEVQLLFDPPTNSYLLENTKKQAEKMEFLMQVMADEERTSGLENGIQSTGYSDNAGDGQVVITNNKTVIYTDTDSDGNIKVRFPSKSTRYIDTDSDGDVEVKY